jgi:hypothetical protein
MATDAATHADGRSFSSMVGQAAADNIVEIRRRRFAAERTPSNRSNWDKSAPADDILTAGRHALAPQGMSMRTLSRHEHHLQHVDAPRRRGARPLVAMRLPQLAPGSAGGSITRDDAIRYGNRPPGGEAYSTAVILEVLSINALTTEHTESTEEEARRLLFFVFSVTSVCSVVNAIDAGY